MASTTMHRRPSLRGWWAVMLAKVPLELDEYLWAQWKCSRLAFVYAPLGFGKSEFAHRMLEGMDVL